jgi:gas vesicle protein
MKTSRLLLIAAAGSAIALLLTTKKGKKITSDLANNAGEWKDEFIKLANQYGDKLANYGGKLSSLKNLVSNEIEGLSDEAREKISAILDEGASSAKKVKSKVGSQLS